MNRFLKVLSVFFLSLVCLAPGFSEDTREEMEVLNIEVPVRVMAKGKPVDNLKKRDFRLYENGKRISINGFTKIKRKIRNDEVDGERKEKVLVKKRLFILAFSVTDFNRQYERGVHYFFQNVVRKNDAAIVMINNVMLTFNDLKNRDLVSGKIISVLQAEGNRARANVLGIFRSVELGLRMLKTELEFSGQGNASSVASIHHNKHILFFLRTYKSAWDDFRSRYLHIDMQPFINLSEYLKKRGGEKWAVSFYQMEKFPMIDPATEIYQKIKQGAGSIGKRILLQVQREFDAERKFPAEAVGKLFISGGVRFDMVMVPARVESETEGIVSGDVSTSIENTLRQMADATGGKAILSGNIGAAFRDISEREDIVYMLTYAPRNTNKKGRLKVKVKNRKYRVVYDSNSRAGFISRVINKKKGKSLNLTMGNFHFKKRDLCFRVGGFQRNNGKGSLKLNLVILSARTGKFHYSRDFVYSPEESPINAKLDLSGLDKGVYDVMVELNDFQSGRTAFEYFQITTLKFKHKVTSKPDQGLVETVPEAVPEDDKLNRALLADVLEGAAVYSWKLENSAFHFFCNEKIVEILDEIEPGSHGSKRVSRKRSTKNHKFDYQLIKTRSGISEQRSKLGDHGKGRSDIHELLISFLSEKPVFAPAMIVGEEGQKDFVFAYRALIKKGSDEFVEIEAVPRIKKKYFFKNALIHINRKDFSVRMIEVTPRYISGFDKLMKRSFQFRTRLYLKSRINFDKGFRGLWFPTLISISERYKGGRFVTQNVGVLGWERSRTEFRYTDYRFFNVDMDVRND